MHKHIIIINYKNVMCAGLCLLPPALFLFMFVVLSLFLSHSLTLHDI